MLKLQCAGFYENEVPFTPAFFYLGAAVCYMGFCFEYAALVGHRSKVTAGLKFRLNLEKLINHAVNHV